MYVYIPGVTVFPSSLHSVGFFYHFYCLLLPHAPGLEIVNIKSRDHSSQESLRAVCTP